MVTHRPIEGTDPIFTVVPGGIESALAKAQEAAGDKRIGLMGANIDQQFLAAGLVDDIRIHVVNVYSGAAVGCSTCSPNGSSWNERGSARTAA